MATKLKIYSDYSGYNLAVDDINHQYRKLTIEQARRIKERTGCQIVFKEQIGQLIRGSEINGKSSALSTG